MRGLVKGGVVLGAAIPQGLAEEQGYWLVLPQALCPGLQRPRSVDMPQYLQMEKFTVRGKDTTCH